MERIEKLAQDQRSKFPEYVERWTSIESCTEPANRKLAEESVALAYKMVDLDPPKVVWCGSPLSAALARAIMLGIFPDRKVVARVRHSVWTSMWDFVWASVRDSVGACVKASVRASVRNSIKDSVGGSVWASAQGSVGTSAWASMWDSVSESVGACVRASVWDSSRASVGNSVVRELAGGSVWASVRASVSESMADSVKASVSDLVRNSVGVSVRPSARTSVRDWLGASEGNSVEASITNSLGAYVWASGADSMRAYVWASVIDSVMSSVQESGYGQHDATWLASFEFFRNECGLQQDTERLLGVMGIAKSANWFLPHQRLCWISERPHTLKRNSQGMLHCDGGPALQYPDGLSIYSLNGVRVSRKIAETPADSLDPGLIPKEQNAEIRREIVRKIGVERVCQALKAVTIDKHGEYELLNLDLQHFHFRPYLKMRNPSTGDFHIEGVHPDCRTVKQALKFRNGTTKQPSILT